MRSERSIAGVVLASWLVAVFAVSVGGRLESTDGQQGLQQLLVGSIVFPMAYFIFTGARFFPRPPFKRSLGARRILRLCGNFPNDKSRRDRVSGISAAHARRHYRVTSVQFNPHAGIIAAALRYYAVVMSVLMAGLIWRYYTPGERLRNGSGEPQLYRSINPSVIIACLAIKNVPIRLLIMVAPVAATILTNSRASSFGILARARRRGFWNVDLEQRDLGTGRPTFSSRSRREAC